MYVVEGASHHSSEYPPPIGTGGSVIGVCRAIRSNQAPPQGSLQWIPKSVSGTIRKSKRTLWKAQKVATKHEDTMEQAHCFQYAPHMLACFVCPSATARVTRCATGKKFASAAFVEVFCLHLPSLARQSLYVLRNLKTKLQMRDFARRR